MCKGNSVWFEIHEFKLKKKKMKVCNGKIFDSAQQDVVPVK